MLINKITGEIAFHSLTFDFDEHDNYLGLKCVQKELKNNNGIIEEIPPKLK